MFLLTYSEFDSQYISGCNNSFIARSIASLYPSLSVLDYLLASQSPLKYSVYTLRRTEQYTKGDPDPLSPNELINTAKDPIHSSIQPHHSFFPLRLLFSEYVYEGYKNQAISLAASN